MSEPQDSTVSCFISARGSKTFKAERTLYELFSYIKTGQGLRPWWEGPGLEKLVEELRTIEDVVEWRDFKASRLPSFTPSARYRSPQRRQADGGYTHSGCVMLDFDHVGVEAVEELRAIAAAVTRGKAPHAMCVFRSPSGDGLKVGVHIGRRPVDKEEHEAAYYACAEVYAGELGIRPSLDEGARSVAQVCFLSWDPGAVVRQPKETHALLWEQFAL